MPASDAREVNARNSQRGFTLVELMIVVAIIALIATIVVPNYIHSRQQAAAATSEANLKQIATALELYYADHNDYPATGNGTVDPTLFCPDGSGNCAYLAQAPKDPVVNQEYTYKHTAVANGNGSYQVAAPGVYDAASLGQINGAGGAANTTDTYLCYTPEQGIFKSSSNTTCS